MLRRFVFDVQHLAQIGDSHLLTLYNCASLRNPRALAGLEEEGLKCLLPQFPDDLAKFLTQHTKPGQRWQCRVVAVRLCAPSSPKCEVVPEAGVLCVLALQPNWTAWVPGS
jgi:hypothetical protein